MMESLLAALTGVVTLGQGRQAGVRRLLRAPTLDFHSCWYHRVTLGTPYRNRRLGTGDVRGGERSGNTGLGAEARPRRPEQLHDNAIITRLLQFSRYGG